MEILLPANPWITSPNGVPDSQSDVTKITVTGRDPVPLPPIPRGAKFTVRHDAHPTTQLMVTLVKPSDPLTPEQFARGDRGRRCPTGESCFGALVMCTGDHYVAWRRDSGNTPIELTVEVEHR